MEIIKIKAELFCRGVRCDLGSELPIPYHPNKRASLSEGKCFILTYGQGKFPINVAVREEFVRNSPFHFSQAEKKIYRDGVPFIDADDDVDGQRALSLAGDVLQKHSAEMLIKSSPSWRTILVLSFPLAAARDRRKSGADRRGRRDRRVKSPGDSRSLRKKVQR